MKLMNQIIEKKLLKFDEDFTNNQNNFWDLYQSINIANSLLPQKLNKNIRNQLWKKIINGHEKSILIMRTLVYKDRSKVYQFLSELKAEEDKEKKMGNMYKNGRFGVLDFEY